ncbi:hypothetical protein BC829DRAFT_450497 [Chytridium lagenaria]|nr:hypothetical protein BC829DRAFT_450497 [Chytridium lagenaria]
MQWRIPEEAQRDQLMVVADVLLASTSTSPHYHNAFFLSPSPSFHLYAPSYSQDGLTGLLNVKVASKEDCTALSSFVSTSDGEGFCDGLRELEVERDGVDGVVEDCNYAMSSNASPIFQFKYQFTAPTPHPQNRVKDDTPLPNTTAVASPTTAAPTPTATSSGIPYKVDAKKNDDGSYTGSILAVAKSYRDCGMIRSWVTNAEGRGFCDGLLPWDRDSGRSFKGECLTEYNTAADKCVFYFDANPSGVYTFKFSFTGKIQTSPSSPTPSSSPSSNVTAFNPIYNSDKKRVEVKLVAMGYSDCLDFRKYAHVPEGDRKVKGLGVCDGLPVWEEGKKKAGSEECIEAFNIIADKCVIAFDKGSAKYDFFFTFDATSYPTWSKRFPTSTISSIPNSLPSTIASSSSLPTFNPVYNPVTHTAALITTASTYAHCAYLRSLAYTTTSKGFCNGLPVWDSSTGRNWRGECIDKYNKVADDCVKAVDTAKIPTTKTAPTNIPTPDMVGEKVEPVVKEYVREVTKLEGCVYRDFGNVPPKCACGVTKSFVGKLGGACEGAAREVGKAVEGVCGATAQQIWLGRLMKGLNRLLPSCDAKKVEPVVKEYVRSVPPKCACGVYESFVGKLGGACEGAAREVGKAIEGVCGASAPTDMVGEVMKGLNRLFPSCDAKKVEPVVKEYVREVTKLEGCVYRDFGNVPPKCACGVTKTFVGKLGGACEGAAREVGKAVEGVCGATAPTDMVGEVMKGLNRLFPSCDAKKVEPVVKEYVREVTKLEGCVYRDFGSVPPKCACGVTKTFVGKLGGACEGAAREVGKAVEGVCGTPEGGDQVGGIVKGLKKLFPKCDEGKMGGVVKGYVEAVKGLRGCVVGDLGKVPPLCACGAAKDFVGKLGEVCEEGGRGVGKAVEGVCGATKTRMVEDLVFEPRFDEKTGKRSLKATAKGYEDCLELRKMGYVGDGKGFCDELPGLAEGREVRRECVEGFSKESDRCVEAFDAANSEYKFSYEFEYTGTKTPSETVKYEPRYVNGTVGEVESVVKSLGGCVFLEEFGNTRKGGFCEGLPAGGRLEKRCLDGYAR